MGEALNPDGTLYTENLRTAKATDHFILSGHGNGCTGSAFHFSWVPLHRDHGSEECLSTCMRVFAQVLHTDFTLYREIEDRQRDDQQVVEQYSVGTAIEFCGAAD